MCQDIGNRKKTICANDWEKLRIRLHFSLLKVVILLLKKPWSFVNCLIYVRTRSYEGRRRCYWFTIFKRCGLFEKINVWLFLWNRVWNLTNNLQIVQAQRFGKKYLYYTVNLRFCWVCPSHWKKIDAHFCVHWILLLCVMNCKIWQIIGK